MDAVTKFLNQLQGYKTYMVAVAAAITAVVAYLNHQLDVIQLVEALLAAAGAATLRQGITTSSNKVINAQAAATAANAAPAGVPNAPNQPADPNNLG